MILSSILFTGGAGFIGGNFVLDWLAQSDEPVINFDKLTYAGNPETLANLEGDARNTLVQGDIGDRALVVIDDQFDAPTGAELITEVSAHAIRQLLNTQNGATLAGVYHLVAGGQTTWFDYARHVLDQARRIQPDLAIKASEVAPVPTSAFPTPAKRPHNSRLDTGKLQATFELTLSSWQTGVNRMLAEIL